VFSAPQRVQTAPLGPKWSRHNLLESAPLIPGAPPVGGCYLDKARRNAEKNGRDQRARVAASSGDDGQRETTLELACQRQLLQGLPHEPLVRGRRPTFIKRGRRASKVSVGCTVDDADHVIQAAACPRPAEAPALGRIDPLPTCCHRRHNRFRPSGTSHFTNI
jgi:hypothetical protein